MNTRSTTARPVFKEGDKVKLVRSLGQALPKGATAMVNERLTNGNPHDDTYTLTFKNWWGYVDAADVEAADKQKNQTPVVAATGFSNTQKTAQPATPPLLTENVKLAQTLLTPPSSRRLKRKAPQT